MSNKKPTSFNHLVYQKAYKRLKLKKRERFIFQRLLGFLIRNGNPFPFSNPSLIELTGYSDSSICESLNKLEKFRLIIRKGMGKNRRFSRGTILDKILTTVQKRINKDLVKYTTTPQNLDKKVTNTPESGYRKTSSSLKHKEGRFLSVEEIQQIAWYKNNPEIKINEEDKYLFDP